MLWIGFIWLRIGQWKTLAHIRSHKAAEFLDQLSDHQLFKKNSATSN